MEPKTIKRILIVEDEAIIGMALAAELEDADFEVIDITPTGKEALAVIQEEIPDLIILDVKLGNGMDGLETLAEIRKIATTCFFIVSGNSDARTVQKIEALGIDGFFVKPVHARMVIQHIHKLNKGPAEA
jgi:DNA-binding response OmpR family regulator